MKLKKHKCKFCGATTERPDPNYLRQIRTDRRVSLASLAEFIGIKSPYLVDIEAGRRKCSERVLKGYEMLEGNHITFSGEKNEKAAIVLEENLQKSSAN